ncbi:TIGR03086 family protein [Nocardioides scoriae]|uniref:TIGR03086 family protein n=1 Tax=Nocardioides scoriae TaxID=642780 RepID=A0A1H1WBL2_9ACTN|nr:TIGR03086 family metal-binding protein [Nocardioides scoriae]SDS94362.1 TIGR03086 family protein [Nocardioides scoriae]
MLAPPVAVAAFDAALDWTHGRLERARDTSPTAPTPCPGWDLRALLVHMDDSLAALAEAASLGRVGVDPGAAPPAATTSELVDRVVRRACATRAAWSARPGGGPVEVGTLALDRDTVALVGAVEVTAHGWDVGVAVGDATPLPEPLAARLLPVALSLVGPEDRPRRFGPALPVTPGAGPAERLLAHLGRGPVRPEELRT